MATISHVAIIHKSSPLLRVHSLPICQTMVRMLQAKGSTAVGNTKMTIQPRGRMPYILIALRFDLRLYYTPQTLGAAPACRPFISGCSGWQEQSTPVHDTAHRLPRLTVQTRKVQGTACVRCMTCEAECGEVEPESAEAH